MNIKTVSIIIPALNEEENIGKCLESVNNLYKGKYFVEVIVVDNGSKDKTVEIAKNYGAEVFVLPNVNISTLRNYGAKFAKGEILAFLDADCIVDRYWLIRSIESFTDEKLGAVGEIHKVLPNSSWVGKTWYINSLKTIKKSFVNYIPSGNLFIRKDVFLEINGFNENLEVSEDTDICYRIREKGWKIIANKEIIAYHLGEPKSLIEFFKKELWHGKDVFKIFLDSKLKFRNFKVVLYAFFYIFAIFFLIIAIVFSKVSLFLLVLFISLSVPLILAFKTTVEKKALKYIFSLWILYFLYGLARALCIINLNNWLFKNEKKEIR